MIRSTSIRSWTGDNTSVPCMAAALTCGQKAVARRASPRTRTEYVHDGRGSVAAEVSYNDSWYTFGGNIGARSARGAVACSKAVGFSAPLAQMPGVFRRPVARPRRLL